MDRRENTFWDQKGHRLYNMGEAIQKQPGLVNKLKGLDIKRQALEMYAAGAAVDRWKKTSKGLKEAKEEAISYWDQKGHRLYNMGEAIQKQPGLVNKLKGLDIKKQAWGMYAAGAAAKLGPENPAELVLDLLSMGRGGYTSKFLEGIFKGGSKAIPQLRRAVKLAQGWADPASKLFKARKAYKLGSVAKRSLAGSGQEAPLAYQPPHRTTYNQPVRDILGARDRKPIPHHRPSKPRPSGPSYSYLDQVKVADWKLQSLFKSSQPARQSAKPNVSVTDRLKVLERQTENSINQKRNIQDLMKRFTKSISQPQPLNAHEQMRQKYGAKIDALAKGFKSLKPSRATMFPRDLSWLKTALNANRSQSAAPFIPQLKSIWDKGIRGGVSVPINPFNRPMARW